MTVRPTEMLRGRELTKAQQSQQDSGKSLEQIQSELKTRLATRDPRFMHQPAARRKMVYGAQSALRQIPGEIKIRDEIQRSGILELTDPRNYENKYKQLSANARQKLLTPVEYVERIKPQSQRKQEIETIQQKLMNAKSKQAQYIQRLKTEDNNWSRADLKADIEYYSRLQNELEKGLSLLKGKDYYVYELNAILRYADEVASSYQSARYNKEYNKVQRQQQLKSDASRLLKEVGVQPTQKNISEMTSALQRNEVPGWYAHMVSPKQPTVAQLTPQQRVIMPIQTQKKAPLLSRLVPTTLSSILRRR